MAGNSVFEAKESLERIYLYNIDCSYKSELSNIIFFCGAVIFP